MRAFLQRSSCRFGGRATMATLLRPCATRSSLCAVGPTPTMFSASMRHYASAASNTALAQACEKELADEQSVDRAAPAVPKGWSYTHAPGSAFFTLTKTEGGESIEIFCEFVEEDPAATAEHPVQEVPFKLRIVRNNRTLEFSLTAVENELVVDNIVAFPEKRSSADFTSSESDRKARLQYQGPCLAHLDEELLGAMHGFLESRGVDDAFASYMIQQQQATEQEEYQKWLFDVKAFAA